MWGIADSVIQPKAKVNYKQMVLENKVEEFVKGLYDIDHYFEEYKGRLIGKNDMYRNYQKLLIDFLDEMFELGFTGKEVCDYIIEKYLAKEEVEDNDI